MFDKRDYRMYAGVKRDELYAKVCDFWARNGFYVAQISPYHLHGQSFHERIGLRREFELRLEERDGNTYADLQFKAKITDTGLVGGVAAAVIFWPVALVGGAYSYKEYEDEAMKLMGEFWSLMDHATGRPGSPVPPPTAIIYPTQVGTVQCKGCGAFNPDNWKACPYCGGAK